MGQWTRDGGELRYRFEERLEIAGKVSNQAISQVGAEFRVLLHQVSEAEAVVVESVDQAAHRFHEAGLFVNAITYPAVPEHQQRFRISLMATHTRADIDRLLDCVASLWPRREPETTPSKPDKSFRFFDAA